MGAHFAVGRDTGASVADTPVGSRSGNSFSPATAPTLASATSLARRWAMTLRKVA